MPEKRLPEKGSPGFQGNQGRLPAGWVVALCISAVFAGLYFFSGDTTPRHIARAQVVQAVDGEVSHELADFADGKARSFLFRSEAQEVRYFILMGADGVVRVALDACEVCWQENLGYVQDGESMVCAHCGLRFPFSQIGMKQGGCHPVPLNHRVEGGRLILSVEDLQEAVAYFTFS